MSLKHLPADERPRERLLALGSNALSNIELIAILLGSGTKTLSVLEMAKKLLIHFQSLEKLALASIQELQEIEGIGLAKAILLHSAFTISQRMEKTDFPILDTTEKIYQVIRKDLEKESVEVLLILLRDIKGRKIHQEIIAKGSLTQLFTHPREIFHMAIKHRAYSIVLAHNHPSGDPTPSIQDIEMTHRLIDISKIVGIELSDHLIIGKGRYFSFINQQIF